MMTVSPASTTMAWPLLILMFATLSKAELVVLSERRYPSTPQLDVSEYTRRAAPVFSSVTPSQSAAAYWSDRITNLISRGVTKFALDMDNAISLERNETSEENIVFSPLSLAGTMTMVLLGSSGRTFEEVSRILGFEVEVDISRHSEIVHQIFGLLLYSISNNVNRPSAPRVNYASGIFVQEDFPIRPEFRTISEAVYRSEVRNLNFRTKSEEARRMVNDWVAEKTMRKIPSILDRPLSLATKVIIASALYFNGEWNQHFIQGATKRKPFFVEPGRSIDVDMMYNGGQFPFYEDRALGAKILALPYKNHEISMYLILPTEEGATALKRFKHRLTADILENLIRNVRNETCIIGVPRMKLSSNLRLRSAFESLGLRSLFNPVTADLSLLSPGGNEVNVIPAPQMAQSFQPAASGIKSSPARPRPPAAPRPSYPDDILIFSRFGEDKTTPPSNTRTQLYKYTVKDYTVNRWNSGFTIQRGNNADRRAVSVEPRRKRERSRRQLRPIDQAFLDFMNTRDLPSFGLDALRNSGQTRNPGLYADEVFHKTVMEVTETGTEAAAATTVSLNRDGSQKRFVANRPFLFFIRHESSRLLLFWGTVYSPTAAT